MRIISPTPAVLANAFNWRFGFFKSLFARRNPTETPIVLIPASIQLSVIFFQTNSPSVIVVPEWTWLNRVSNSLRVILDEPEGTSFEVKKFHGESPVAACVTIDVWMYASARLLILIAVDLLRGDLLLFLRAICKPALRILQRNSTYWTLLRLSAFHLLKKLQNLT